MHAQPPIHPTTVRLSRIVRGDNPRRYFDRQKLEDLMASMRVRGLLQPILLRPKGDSYAIVAGERRYPVPWKSTGLMKCRSHSRDDRPGST